MKVPHKISTSQPLSSPANEMWVGQIGVVATAESSLVVGHYVMMTYGGRLISLNIPSETWVPVAYRSVRVHLLYPGQVISLEIGR